MDVPRSKQFDDVYFSKKDGLAEARYVFLDGNNLPDAWEGRNSFTICESGFGTGLNFLALLKLWLESDVIKKAGELHFISFEKYPLDRGFIEKTLSCWDELGDVLTKLLSVYPADISSDAHDMQVLDDVRLTLIFGDINNEIPKLETKVDCWFLDGFKPSTNPDMWSDLVFENMARLSSDKASFATFTSAGFVRRGLQACGFDVLKVKGFSYKREMCVGLFSR